MRHQLIASCAQCLPAKNPPTSSLLPKSWSDWPPSNPSSLGSPATVAQALACYSIRQFCAAHGISEDMFFKIQRQGFAPKTMRVGARTLISIEAAAEWRHERESHDPAPVMQSHPRGKIVAAENRRSVASPVKRRAALSHPNPAHEPVREITAHARGRRRALATE